jgi:hypothetical protein
MSELKLGRISGTRAKTNTTADPFGMTNKRARAKAKANTEILASPE